MEWRRWRARVAAAVMTGGAAVGAVVTYHAFRGEGAGDVLGSYAVVLGAAIVGFIGMVPIAILLSSRFTADYARDPLRVGFRVCAGAALVGLPMGTGGATLPSWTSFLTAVTFSVVVTTAWAKFLGLLIADRLASAARSGLTAPTAHDRTTATSPATSSIQEKLVG